jgi:phosphoribosylformimino-5-aminoimidazole carboxamide ribotide isomerase
VIEFGPVIELWPAIDLMDGKVVRLLHGDPARRTVYGSDPAETARQWEAEGADGVHVVDLDAAFGTGGNRAAVEKVVAAVRIPVEVGGGLRSRESVGAVLGAGAARAVLGSLPFADPALSAALLAAHPGRLVAALDCRDGRPTVKGWTEVAGEWTAAGAAAHLASLGVSALLVTDVARDGAMTGPNTDLLAQVRRVFPGEVLASGGMRGPQDLAPVARALAGGPAGAIFGRALHEGATTVARLAGARRSAEEVA